MTHGGLFLLGNMILIDYFYFPTYGICSYPVTIDYIKYLSCDINSIVKTPKQKQHQTTTSETDFATLLMVPSSRCIGSSLRGHIHKFGTQQIDDDFVLMKNLGP